MPQCLGVSLKQMPIARASPLPSPASHPRAREARQAIECLDHAARIERGSHRLVRRPVAHIGWCGGNLEPRTQNPESRDPGSRVPDPWDRDEWDVALADGPTYRLFRERHSDKWFLEGVVD